MTTNENDEIKPEIVSFTIENFKINKTTTNEEPLSLDMELAKKFNSDAFLMGSFIVIIKPDDERIRLRTDCPFCMLHYNYAKNNNKQVLYNLCTEDIVGVALE